MKFHVQIENEIKNKKTNWNFTSQQQAIDLCAVCCCCLWPAVEAESSINKFNLPIWCFYLWQTSNVIKIFPNLIYHFFFLFSSSFFFFFFWMFHLYSIVFMDQQWFLERWWLWCVFQSDKSTQRAQAKSAHRDQAITSFWSKEPEREERKKNKIK